MLQEFLSLALTSVVSLLPIANPFSTAPIFLSLTGGMTVQQRRKIARRTSLYVFFILVVCFLAGRLIMEFFGITVPGLRIAGGLLIMKFGLGALSGAAIGEQSTTAPPGSKRVGDIAFTPLAMPSLSGPGAIAATISLASVVESPIQYPAVIVGILVLAVVSYFVLRESYRVTHFLGENGMRVLVNVMGFIILCIGVQYLLDGVVDVVNSQLKIP